MSWSTTRTLKKIDVKSQHDMEKCGFSWSMVVPVNVLFNTRGYVRVLLLQKRSATINDYTFRKQCILSRDIRS
jgi:hypothetical protein